MMIWSVLLALLWSCNSDSTGDQGVTNGEPKVIFTGLFIKRPTSLKILLGEKFTVEDIVTSEVSSYDVHYDRQTRLSFITNIETGDTTWIGYADKGNKIWMLETPISDTAFYASGLAIQGDFIHGFRGIDAQRLEFEKLVAAGKLDFMLLNGDYDNPVLHADRIDIQPHLEGVLSRLQPRYKLVNERNVESKGGFDSVIEHASVTSSGILTVKFKQPGDYIVEVSNGKGSKVSMETGGLPLFEMDAKLAMDQHVLMRVLRKETGEELEKMKLTASK